jgi:hypothetical protein
MVVSVVCSAQRHCELVADLESHSARLSEPQMVGVGWVSPADQARLGSNELEMSFVAKPARLADQQFAFLYFAGSGVGLIVCRSRRVLNDGWGGWERGCRNWRERGADLSRAPPRPFLCLPILRMIEGASDGSVLTRIHSSPKCPVAKGARPRRRPRPAWRHPPTGGSWPSGWRWHEAAGVFRQGLDLLDQLHPDGGRFPTAEFLPDNRTGWVSGSELG